MPRWLGRQSRPASCRHHQQHQRQRADGRDDHPGDPRASRQHHQQQHGNQSGHGQADPVAQPPGPHQGSRGRHQHQGRHQLRDVKVPLAGLDQHQQQPEQPEQHGGHPHHSRTRAPASSQNDRLRGALGHDQLPSVAGAFLPDEAPSDPSMPARIPWRQPRAISGVAQDVDAQALFRVAVSGRREQEASFFTVVVRQRHSVTGMPGSPSRQVGARDVTSTSPDTLVAAAPSRQAGRKREATYDLDHRSPADPWHRCRGCSQDRSSHVAR